MGNLVFNYTAILGPHLKKVYALSHNIKFLISHFCPTNTQCVSPVLCVLCKCSEAFASSGSWHVCDRLVAGKICSPGAIPIPGGSDNWDITNLVIILGDADAMFPCACSVATHVATKRKNFSVSSTM